MPTWRGAHPPLPQDLLTFEGRVDELTEEKLKELASTLGLHTNDNPPRGVLLRRIKGSEVR